MKIFVLSDTHKILSLAKNAISSIDGLTHIFHLGDMVSDAEELKRSFPNIKVIYVKGNNDFYSDAPEDITIDIEGVKFFMSHGHHYGVKGSIVRFAYKTTEVGADFGLFGHTHVRCEEKYLNSYILNPSSYGYYIIEGKEKFEFFDY